MAQQHQGMGHTGDAAATDPAMAGMHAAQQRMDQRMRQATPSGERNFAEITVPHHEGAVEVARAALPTIHDPELRRMAEKTIQENEHEAQELRAWLQRHG